uniref:Dynein axonemal heavy chain 9 n=1 Tax=Saimiri boliviensis boliviensis TaxID=39432 RepID=A0A2K6TMQ8_SAIBB
MPNAEERAALAAANADEEAGADPRLRLLGTFVAQSLRPAAGAWERCAGTAEAEQLLQAFLRRAATEGPWPLLVVRPAPGGLVVLPVLANEKNRLDWPHMVYQDVRQQAHSLHCDLLVILEQVKGKTLLPLPAGSEEMEFADSKSETVLDSIDKSVIYAIESAVIKWSYQVQVVLKRESSQPLLQGENPTPKVELEFWKSRYEDLKFIYHQLRTIKVRGMARLLDKLQSSYFPAFKAMYREVVTGEDQQKFSQICLTQIIIER